MEQMKQCPNCGKYVSAAKTYCMHCGATLGVKCPHCARVLPVGSHECPCGHSFVRKDKKPPQATLLPYIKKNARPMAVLSLLLVVIALLVLSAFPALRYRLTDMTGKDPVESVLSASGYTLAGYFLGAHPADIDILLSDPTFTDSETPLRLCLYGAGLGWLILLVAMALAVVLVLPNHKKLSRATSRRLLVLLGTSLGGAALLLGFDIAVRVMLHGAASTVYLVPEVLADGTVMPLLHAVSIGAFAPIAVVALTLALFGWHLFLYSCELNKCEGVNELSLGAILKYPFVSLGRLLRRLRKKKPDVERNERTVVCTKRFTTYLVLLAVSLVFTQALLSKISNIFFWFLLLLPAFTLLYTLVAKSALTVSMLSDSTTTEKNAPYTYEFRIDNRSPLAFPFIDADMSIPQTNSVRCTHRTVRLSMAPMTSYHIKNTVNFRFRGAYDIGVKCFYVYDFFRMFRIRVPVENMTTVYVLPRRLSMEDVLAQAVSDSTARTVRSPLVVDKLEVSDVRDYRLGDPLKSIHWKLSSKSEDFIVKDYNTGTSNQTVVFCDLAAHFPDEPPAAPSEAVEDTLSKKEQRKRAREERQQARAAEKARKTGQDRKGRIAETEDTHALSDEALNARLEQRAAAAEHLSGMNASPLPTEEEDLLSASVNVHELASPTMYEDMNEYLADGVVELTIAAVLSELRGGHDVLLIWFDRRSNDGVYAYPLRGIDEFEHIYHLFATAPLCEKTQSVTRLTSMVSDIRSAKQLFMVSAMDDEMLTDLSSLPGVSDAGSFGSIEVILYNPENRFRYPAERTAYLDGCREQLLASGLSLTASSIRDALTQGGEVHET